MRKATAMQIEIRIRRRRNLGPAMFVGVLWLVLISAVVIKLHVLRHSPPTPPPPPLTQAEKSRQAVALAGVAAAGNAGTAIYTPMLFAMATTIQDEEGETNNVPAN